MSNNTNKLSPQEQTDNFHILMLCSNNTNKLSPQESGARPEHHSCVQIIQINLVLKNNGVKALDTYKVQIIQINLVLKNTTRKK